VDLQNYSDRIPDIERYMHPTSIEIFSVPQNYKNEYILELPEKQGSSTYPLLSKELARDMGKKLKEHGITKVQYHYPPKKSLLDMSARDLAITLKFCDIILRTSDVERFTVNYHNFLNYPIPRKVEELNGNDRKKIIKMLDDISVLSQHIKSGFDMPMELIVENNAGSEFRYDETANQYLAANVDLAVEDYINRKGIDGTTLDYSHAWLVVKCFEKNKKYPNLEWCKRQYGGIPESGKSIKSFVRMASPKIRWIHLSDESYDLVHSALHIGEGNIDFVECLGFLNKYLSEETPTTIEINNGHSPEGFKKIVEKDYPRLSELFTSV